MSRRTGLVIGTEVDLGEEAATSIIELLEERFPGVTVAVVAGIGAQSLAFEFDE